VSRRSLAGTAQRPASTRRRTSPAPPHTNSIAARAQPARSAAGGLRLAQGIADRKRTMPMLANVLLRTQGKNQLLVAATISTSR
jgi:hypothetical protein